MAWAQATGPQHETVLSSRVRLARNLSRAPFTSVASPKACAAVLQSVFGAARKAAPFKGAAFLELEGLEAIERQFLIERRLISHALAAEPKHRAVIVGEREVLSVMVNEEDHLRLQAVDSGLCLKELWQKAEALDEALAQGLEFAADPRWGHLTACPTNAGTGLRLSALVHLPALSLAGQINPLLEGLGRLQMTARGIYGEGTKVIGDFYQISNATTMGLSEAQFLEKVARAVSGLVAKEMDLRRSLVEGAQKTQVEDLIYRALGILSHARRISYEETMQHLSYLRMALSLGWKVPASFEMLNELIILAQPAHIQMVAQKELSAADRDFLRAALLRKKFKA